MNSKNPDNYLDSIIFISVPENLDRTIGNFTIDPAILLPVETIGGSTEFNIQDLSWEMIISAMLKILSHQSDHKNADYYRQFILAVNPNIVEELTQTAIFKAQNKDFDIAEELFLAAKGVDPIGGRSDINLALLYEARGENYITLGNDTLSEEYFEKAFECYKTIFTMENVPEEAYLNGGYFFLNRRNYDRALQYFETYIRFSEDEETKTEIHRIISDIESQNLSDDLFKAAYDFIKMGKEAEGIEQIKKFLEANSEVWNGWFLLGWANRRLQNYEDGKAAFLEVLKHNKGHADTYNELAICEMELENFKDSMSHLRTALQLDPENIKIISNLGILALKMGKNKEAEGYFRTVLEYEPEDPIAHEYLKLIEKAD